MRSYLIVILFIFISINTPAQSTFERVYLVTNTGTVNREYCYKTIELPNGCYASIGLNDGCAFCSSNFYIRCVDHTGNYLWQHVVVAGNRGYGTDIIIGTDGNIYFMLNNIIENLPGQADYKISLFKYDLNGTLLNSNNISIAYDNIPMDFFPQLYKLVDSTITLISYRYGINFNFNLDSLNSKNMSNSIALPFKNKNNGISMLCKVQINNRDTLIINNYDTVLDSVSSTAFETGVYKYLQSPYFTNFLAQTGDGSFIITSGRQSTADTAWFMRLDSNLILQWSRSYANGGMEGYFMNAAFDSVAFYVIGVIGNNSGNYSGIIYKFNYNGDSLYFKSFEAESLYTETVPNLLALSSEGNLIISGSAQNDTSQHNSYIAVFDTSGNVVSSTEQKLNSTSGFLISPNPSHGSITILPEENKIYTILLKDFSGKELFHKESCGPVTIDMSSLTSGVYFVTTIQQKNTRTYSVIRN